ncbi:hypothetical protein ACWKT5_29240 [Streptomyces avermitilis]
MNIRGPLAPERRRHPRLDYSEWTSAEVHQEAAESGRHDKVHEIFSHTPGVRLTHRKRYHLHRSLPRPSA